MEPNADPNEFPNRVKISLDHIAEFLSRRGILNTLNASNALSPELILSAEKKIVIGEEEVLFVLGFNKFLNDYKYDVYYLGKEINCDDLLNWISTRL